MSGIEKIKIVQLGRKSQPSKFKPGEMYAITTIMDDKNRKLGAMGAWAEKWVVGDVIEGTIVEKKWTDKDGFEQVSLNIENPNKKEFSPRGGGSYSNPVIVSYQLAATLAPLFFEGKKKLTLADIDSLAAELKKRIDVVPAASAPEQKSTPVAEKKEVVPEVSVDDAVEDDDDKPF